MIGRIKCFDVVSEIIDEANTTFAPGLVCNKEKYGEIKRYCDIIDSISDEFDGISFEVEVDAKSKDISISLQCGEISIDTKGHKMYKLIQSTKGIEFGVGDDGGIVIKFVFGGIWHENKRMGLIE